MKKNRKYLLITSIIGVILFAGCSSQPMSYNSSASKNTPKQSESDVVSKIEETIPTYSQTINLSSIPDYSGSPYIDINGNEPYFSEDEYTTSSFEYYADFDKFGWCCTAYACIGKDIMPSVERGSFGQIKPTGWLTV